MSAFLTHLAVGALLGLALRLPLKYIPAAALLAEVHDIDHMDTFLGWSFVESRVTFHNITFCILLPLVIFGILYWRRAKPEHLHLAAAAPVLMTSHLLLDMLPFEHFGSVSKLPLFYPFSDVWYTLPLVVVQRVDPREFSTMTIIFLTLIGMTVVSLLVRPYVTKPRESGHRASRHVGAFAFATVWILLVPGLAAAGLFTPPPNYANAALSLDDASVELSEGRFTALVRHMGGSGIGRGGLTVDVESAGSVLLSVANPEPLQFGRAWAVVVELPPSATEASAFTASLRASNGNVTYAKTTPVVDRTPLPLKVEMVRLEHDGRGTGYLTLGNVGDRPIPPEALLIQASAGGNAADPLTNAKRLQPGDVETMTFPLPAVDALEDVHVRVLARVGQHEYLDESARPELRNPLGTMGNRGLP